ncbi:MAG: SDR family oxidoreductase [Alphaproteobacteria bacterium]|nr:SDR family oxidoreductase [Alphaproteobacteria bacterium]
MDRLPLYDLDGRTALVTGANRGIGLEIARGLVRAGARTLLLCRDAGRGAEAARELSAEGGGEVVLVPCDLSDIAAVEATAVALLSDEDGIDVLVHNAGVYPQDRELTDQGVERTFAVDVLGPWLLTHRLVPLLRSAAELRGHARIVQLAGIYHLRGTLDLDDLHFADRAYDAATANAQAQLARVVLARAWARGLFPDDIRVNAVHPGPVLTDALQDAPWLARVAAHTVARPAFHSPEQGAAPVLRLCCDADLHVTGAFYRRDELHAGHEASYDLQLAEQLWEALEAMVEHPDRQPLGMHSW